MADSIASVVNQITSATSGTSTLSSSASIAKNFDSFLRLLTTQLQNQNPLEPLDTNQFTQQLVQFSSVEQAIKTNDNLENLLRLQLSSATTAVIGYIGKTVTIAGSVGQLADGKAVWTYRADGAMQSAEITIRDASGAVVFSDERAMGAARGSFEWDGRLADGSLAPDGAYTISIIGRDADGEAVGVKTSASAVVDGVDLTGDEPMLMIGDIRVALDAITSVGQR